jgi:hypothetical protein
VKLVMGHLGVDPPPDHRIRAEIDVDQRLIGEDYAVPTAESIARGEPPARPSAPPRRPTCPEPRPLATSRAMARMRS